MKQRSLPFQVVAALLVASGFLFAQEQPSSGHLSITVSNQMAGRLTLYLLRVPFIPPPSTPLSSDPGQTPLPMPKNEPVKPATVQPKQSAALKVSPGQYELHAIVAPTLGGKVVSPLRGFISVTNAEVWLFKLEEKDEQIGGPSFHCNLEVPSRPGFHLLISPEGSSLPVRSLRPQPSPAFLAPIAQPTWAPSLPPAPPAMK
jgi:hypothetical protein